MQKGKILKCNILRKKDGTNKLNPKFIVYTESGQRFLFSAKKKIKNLCSVYHISLSRDIYEEGELYLGEVKSNFMGTNFNHIIRSKNAKKKILSTVNYVISLSNL